MDSYTEIVSSQEPRRDDVRKQKEGGNRRALQEISNLVNTSEGNPITKNLVGLTLVSNDPPAIGKNNDTAVQKKKVTYKADPDTIIIISSDDEEEKKGKDLSKVKKKCTRRLNSLTSVLTARSKAACWDESKPRERVINIDAADVNNELAVVEYVEEIYKFYRDSEDEYRMRDYMSMQVNMNQKMRMVLVDWLIEVHNKFDLLPETLYLAIDQVDRYLTKNVILRRELQLVGISSMLLACKYEEIWAPEVDDFISISEKAYSREQVLVMEKSILANLEWNLTVATPYVFLVRFIKASVPSNKEVENMAFFLAESGLMHYDLVLSCRPSLIAAASVYAALRCLNRIPWTETLHHYTGYADHEIKRCADKLVSLHMAAKKSNLQAVFRKFTDPEKDAVALLPLA